MKTLKEKIQSYKVPPKGVDSKLTPWQEYALQVCHDFKLAGSYKAMIFRHAKSNISYLRGRVENTKEKFGTENLEMKANYLISLFRKTPPWKK